MAYRIPKIQAGFGDWLLMGNITLRNLNTGHTAADTTNGLRMKPHTFPVSMMADGGT